jgi:putative peptidoglycan lipid II flippase
MKGRLLSISSVAVLNFFGMVAGFFVNSFLAYSFGAGFETDAYLIASMVPTFFVYMMGFDSLKGLARTLFIDVSKNRKEGLSAAFCNLFNATLVAGVLISVIAFFLTPLIVKLLAPGSSDETHILATSLCKIMIPSIFLIALANLSSSILNMWNQFFLPSFGIFFQKVIIIFSIVAFCSIIGIYSAAIGMLVGAIFSLLIIMLPIFLSDKIIYSFKLDMSSAILKDFVKLFSPLIFLMLIMQVNSAVIQFLGSFYEQGTITKLNYAKSVASLIIPVIVTPVLSVYLNDFCTHVSEKDTAGLVQRYRFVYRVLLLFLGFVILLQFSFPKNIISILFQRGAFTANDVNATSLYYIIFLIGVPFQAYGLLANYLLLAAKRTDLILKVGIYTVCANLAFSTLLACAYGPVGIVIGASAAWFVHALVFHMQAKNIVQIPLLENCFKWTFKIFFLLLLILVGMLFIWHPVQFSNFDANWNNILNISLGGIVAMTFFVIFLIIFKVEEGLQAIKTTRRYLSGRYNC